MGRSHQNVGPVYRRGTPQYPWRPAGTGRITGTGGTLSAAGAYAQQTTLPTERLAGAGASPGRYVIEGLDPTDAVLFKFLLGTANNVTATYSIWGMRWAGVGSNEDIFGDWLVTGALTAGNAIAAGITSSNVIPTGVGTGLPLFPVDIITVTTDQTLNATSKLYTDQADSWATLYIDGSGFLGYIIEILHDGGGTASTGSMALYAPM